MKLRNFLYLNTKIVNDYLSSIEGYIYDEEAQSIATSSENALKAGIGGRLFSGDGAHTGKAEEEDERRKGTSSEYCIWIRQNNRRLF